MFTGFKLDLSGNPPYLARVFLDIQKQSELIKNDLENLESKIKSDNAKTFEPALTKGNLTATAPVYIDKTVQVIGEAAALTLKNDAGAALTSFSTDGTLAGNSATDGVVESAVKGYVDFYKVAMYSTGAISDTGGFASFVNVTGLSAALVASASYQFETHLKITGYAGGNVRVGVNFSAAGSTLGPTSALGSTSGITAIQWPEVTALNTAITGFVTAAYAGFVVIKGVITTGVNAGDFTIMWGRAAAGSISMAANSYLNVTRIS